MEEYSLFSSLSLCLCYSLFLYSCAKVIDYLGNSNTNNTNNTNNLNEITELPNFALTSSKECHTNEYKQKMFQVLLDTNSLERCYILYFIFKKKGNFKTSTSTNYIIIK